MRVSRFRAGTATIALAASAHALPVGSAETVTYTYDALGRLVVVQKSGTVNNGQTQAICYDRAGNRIRYVSAPSGPPVPCPTPTP